jgi:hypothetical protein
MFRVNGWYEQRVADVDWQHDYVFSYFMDPTRRHVKGLVEDAICMGIEHDLVQLSRQTLHNIPWLGEHSVPLSVYWGSNFQKINWILIDNATQSHERDTVELCKKHGIELDLKHHVNCNESDDYERAIFDRVYSICGDNKPLIARMSHDYEIFHRLLQQPV